MRGWRFHPETAPVFYPVLTRVTVHDRKLKPGRRKYLALRNGGVLRF